MTALVVHSLDALEAHVGQRLEFSSIQGHYESMVAPRVKVPGVERSRPEDTFLDDLAKCSLPVLLVEGINDELLETGWSDLLADRLPNGRSLKIETAHEANIDQPAIVVELVGKFLSSLA